MRTGPRNLAWKIFCGKLWALVLMVIMNYCVIFLKNLTPVASLLQWCDIIKLCFKHWERYLSQLFHVTLMWQWCTCEHCSEEDMQVLSVRLAVCYEGQYECSHATAHRRQAIPMPTLWPALPYFRPPQEPRSAAFQVPDVTTQEIPEGQQERPVRDGVCQQ